MVRWFSNHAQSCTWASSTKMFFGASVHLWSLLIACAACGMPSLYICTRSYCTRTCLPQKIRIHKIYICNHMHTHAHMCIYIYMHYALHHKHKHTHTHAWFYYLIHFSFRPWFEAWWPQAPFPTDASPRPSGVRTPRELWGRGVSAEDMMRYVEWYGTLWRKITLEKPGKSQEEISQTDGKPELKNFRRAPGKIP